MDSGVAAMLTLSTEVNKALKLEIEGFLQSNHEFNRENFVANTTALDRVFRVLKRFDLIKEYEPKEFSEEFLSLLD
jgi:hypothetical protein